MNIRTAFVSLALVLASVPAFGQGNHANANSNGGSNGAKDISAAVADLQARVAKLEGNITASDLVGTYKVIAFDTSLSALLPGSPTPQRPATIDISADSGTLTLDAQGGGTLTLENCGGSRLTQGPWTVDPFGGEDCSQPPPAVSWSYGNGTLSLTLAGEGPFNFAVSNGGRLWVLAAAPFHAQDNSAETLVFIATRLQ